MRVVGDGHNARHDGQGDAQLFTIVNETEIGIGIVKILRDGGVRARLHLALEIAQIGFRIGGLRMHFRVGRHLNVEMFAGFGADKRHQLVGIAELPSGHHPRWHVTA